MTAAPGQNEEWQRMSFQVYIIIIKAGMKMYKKSKINAIDHQNRHVSEQEKQLIGDDIWSLGTEVIICKQVDTAVWGHASPEAANSFWILMWNQSQGASIESEGIVYPLSEEHVFLVAPHTKRYYNSEAPFSQFYIQFNITGNTGSAKPGVYRMPSGFIRKIFPKIIHGKDEISRRLAIYSLIAWYLTRLPVGTFSVQCSSGMDSRIENALAIIEAEYMHSIPLATLCKRVRMSKSNFLRNFTRSTGMSPARYIRTLRFRRAGQLLRLTNKSIAAIAEELGYVDRYHFSKSFKAGSGLSPVEFRRKVASESSGFNGDL